MTARKVVQIPRRITVEIDSREKYPLVFPAELRWKPGYGWSPAIVRVATKVVTLEVGDYRLKENPLGAVIERKASLSELYGNLIGKDRSRAIKAFRKLSSVRHPYIWLDCSLSELWVGKWAIAGGDRMEVDPGIVLDNLMNVSIEIGAPVWLMGTNNTIARRRMLGEAATRLLLAHYWEELNAQ